MSGEKQNLKALERASQGTLASRFYLILHTYLLSTHKTFAGWMNDGEREKTKFKETEIV